MQLETPSAVIDALGGTTAVARLTGHKPTAVSNWRRRPTLPPDTYVLLSGALIDAGYTALPALWGMVARQPAPDLREAL